MTDYPTRDDYCDALAIARARLRNDHEGQLAVARACDPVAMMDALVDLYLGVMLTMTGTQPSVVDAWLGHLLNNIDEAISGEVE